MKNILKLASSSTDRLAAWQQELGDLVGSTITTKDLESLRDDVVRSTPEVTLLDFELIGSDDYTSLSRICADTKIIVIGSDIPEETEWRLLKAGIRGCCQNGASPELLRQIVVAVCEGELWIRRCLTGRLIDELGRRTAKNQVYRESLGMLSKLTQREYDIAVLVGKGESNKLIAKACGITERTVKAHLTEVFYKLGVADRVKLALLLSADDRATVRKSPNSALDDQYAMSRAVYSDLDGLISKAA